jgi:hypothetical protein
MPPEFASVLRYLSIAAARDHMPGNGGSRVQTLVKISLMAAVRDVPNVTRLEVTVRARHRSFLEGTFHGQKAASKLLNDAFYAYLKLINQGVGRVR